ncbi:DnaJ domain-containing protein [Brachyspira hyodysenteriae]|uniref:DnaJ domain-containing protein n=1 Tax=Brachyspira hyodysenteriae TaxID=159 RepID=UPI0022CD9B18|nr:DnaJ domain-containing protein [Brachyspira hyodysenteriae]MCZ9851900.1 DnaJ domain-containing protein [Brachyspira hyodysenteriae]MCZ9861525.1 DnaJ domain-containing protein [Brachyspira hyodysenteriae]MCZ9890728.1 DnaJ domain-containing protein [Brachyspira hyodysenteriae]MCZ9894056.1 DnaJ domain-containing protein [Brachyspira hyodysenteriae]MCZ9915314.1 DnaJ domain-containing protein [Brachyspira hyodysenteriae]
MDKDYYKILNVNMFSSNEKIKKSYRELAMKFHPYRNPGNEEANRRFIDINEAYEILSNKETRMQYNIKYLSSNKYVVGGLAAAGVGLGLILSRRKK